MVPDTKLEYDGCCLSSGKAQSDASKPDDNICHTKINHQHTWSKNTSVASSDIGHDEKEGGGERSPSRELAVARRVRRRSRIYWPTAMSLSAGEENEVQEIPMSA